MPPVDAPRGNNAAAKPPPVPKPKVPAASPPRANLLPHGSGVISTPGPAPSRPASAYRNPPSAATSSKAPATSPSSKLTQALAQRVPAQLTLQRTLQRLWQGPDQAALAPFDPIARNIPQIVQQLVARSQFNQDFAGLKQAGLLPANAKQPALSFPANGVGPQGELSYEKNGTVFLSPTDVIAAANLQSPLHAWSQEIPIHEIAHSLQRLSVLRNAPLREGGAQAYADAAVPAVLGPIPTHDTNYTGYVNQVRANQGVPWFMRKQFR